MTEQAVINALQTNIEKVIIGKPEVVKLTIVSLLAHGHILIEDIPGVGKTMLARALARSIDCPFKRIQFTPDMLPSDVLGVSVYDAASKEFVFKPGPIFANIILADEVNRTTPRTQSALLEAMNEGQVTIDGTRHKLSAPFMIIATQNPLEFTGTYPLPESQMDRFLMCLQMGYPLPEEEKQILQSRRTSDPIDNIAPVAKAEDIMAAAEAVKQVRVAEALYDYLLAITEKTRQAPDLLTGVSPRGALYLYRAGQALALVNKRDYVTPDDIKYLAVPVLAHRVIEKSSRTIFGSRKIATKIIKRILSEVPVPQ